MNYIDILELRIIELEDENYKLKETLSELKDNFNREVKKMAKCCNDPEHINEKSIIDKDFLKSIVKKLVRNYDLKEILHELYKAEVNYK